MKNGSLANNSEMKIPTHTGTHVDSPGHVYDKYYDAGFDVDSLDLQVLNGMIYKSIFFFFIFVLSLNLVKDLDFACRSCVVG